MEIKHQLRDRLGRWVADRKIDREISGYVEGKRVLAQVIALNRALTARIDALELYVDDVTEKYLKKVDRKERYAREKEERPLPEPVTAFEMIREKYGGRE